MNTTPITLPSGSYLLVKVPENADNITVGWLTQRLWYDVPSDPNRSICLPEGHWHLLGEVAEIGEEVAATIVESVGLKKGNPRKGKMLYKYYSKGGSSVLSPTASLRSLLAANNVEGRCVILKLNN